MTNALKSSIARLGNKLDEHKKDAVPMNAGIDDLVPYAKQARTDFNDVSLQELADSIKAIGIIEPLLVRALGNGKFEIIAGERRWRAARLAGLTSVPVLVRAIDDAMADKIHLAENIHRENLSTLDLAQRVARDLDESGGDLAVVAAKYNKGKPWVSKLSAIAQGGATMSELVVEGVTADRAVLAAVSSLERKAPEQAKALSDQLKVAPEKSNKRTITERFMKDQRAPKPGKVTPVAGKAKRKAEPAEKEPAWRSWEGLDRESSKALILVELSPMSDYVAEFAELSQAFGRARLVVELRHPDEVYAIIQFGNTSTHRRAYRADELRLLSVH